MLQQRLYLMRLEIAQLDGFFVEAYAMTTVTKNLFQCPSRVNLITILPIQ